VNCVRSFSGRLARRVVICHLQFFTGCWKSYLEQVLVCRPWPTDRTGLASLQVDCHLCVLIAPVVARYKYILLALLVRYSNWTSEHVLWPGQVRSNRRRYSTACRSRLEMHGYVKLLNVELRERADTVAERSRSGTTLLGHRKWNEMQWKCIDLKCVRKLTKNRLSLTLTHHANKSSRWAE